MNVLSDLVMGLIALAAAVKLLTLNLWRAVLFVAPGSVQLRSEGALEPEALPAPLAPLADQLRELGFVALCTHSEKPLLHGATRCYDLVHPGERTFATLYLSEGQRPLAYFLTPLAPEGSVLTREPPRPGFVLPGRYGARGRDEPVLGPLWLAHQERLRGLTRSEDITPETRLQVGRAWYRGAGQREIRRQNVQGLLWTLVALAMVAFLFGSRAE